MSDLFDICEARHRGADTSVAAHSKIHDRLPAARQAVLDVIRIRGQATLDDIAADLGVGKNVISGRVSELRRDGVIEVCGKATNAGGMTVRVYREGANG